MQNQLSGMVLSAGNMELCVHYQQDYLVYTAIFPQENIGLGIPVFIGLDRSISQFRVGIRDRGDSGDNEWVCLLGSRQLFEEEGSH